MEEHRNQVARAQEVHLSHYRAIVSSKRDQILQEIGVDPANPWTVEQVLVQLEEHLKKRLSGPT